MCAGPSVRSASAQSHVMHLQHIVRVRLTIGCFIDCNRSASFLQLFEHCSSLESR